MSAVKPARCACTVVRVATLAETLDCPGRWYPAADGTWVHAWTKRNRNRISNTPGGTS